MILLLCNRCEKTATTPEGHFKPIEPINTIKIVRAVSEKGEGGVEVFEATMHLCDEHFNRLVDQHGLQFPADFESMDDDDDEEEAA